MRETRLVLLSEEVNPSWSVSKIPTKNVSIEVKVALLLAACSLCALSC
jgi:hypothetical protein